MTANTFAAIFDMDGLLFDTDPHLWRESMWEVSQKYGVKIDPALFKYTQGLRIYEVTSFWKEKIGWEPSISAREMGDEIIENITQRTIRKGQLLPGVLSTLETLHAANIRMGVATSSPMKMLAPLIEHFGIGHYFEHLSSADTCDAGKPHPEVYLNCAAAMGVQPWNCVAFEDSVNGMVAANAARMKVIVVPEHEKIANPKFGLADLILPSLSNFNLQEFEAVCNL